LKEEENMPRAAAQRRRPTEADLNDAQRRIYDVLPPDFKEEFLRQLPDIAVSSAQARKKAQLIRERVHLLERVIGDLQSHRTHLNQLAKDLEQGAGPESIDLRQELKPPAINGVAMRYVRGRRS
jgi:hypothetical protein